MSCFSSIRRRKFIDFNKFNLRIRNDNKLSSFITYFIRFK